MFRTTSPSGMGAGGGGGGGGRYLTYPGCTTGTAQALKELAFPLLKERVSGMTITQSLNLFSLLLGITQIDRGSHFELVTSHFLSVPGIEPISSVFLGECVNH